MDRDASMAEFVASRVAQDRGSAWSTIASLQGSAYAEAPPQQPTQRRTPDQTYLMNGEMREFFELEDDASRAANCWKSIIRRDVVFEGDGSADHPDLRYDCECTCWTRYVVVVGYRYPAQGVCGG